MGDLHGPVLKYHLEKPVAAEEGVVVVAEGFTGGEEVAGEIVVAGDDGEDGAEFGGRKDESAAGGAELLDVIDEGAALGDDVEGRRGRGVFEEGLLEGGEVGEAGGADGLEVGDDFLVEGKCVDFLAGEGEGADLHAEGLGGGEVGDKAGAEGRRKAARAQIAEPGGAFAGEDEEAVFEDADVVGVLLGPREIEGVGVDEVAGALPEAGEVKADFALGIEGPGDDETNGGDAGADDLADEEVDIGDEAVGLVFVGEGEAVDVEDAAEHADAGVAGIAGDPAPEEQAGKQGEAQEGKAAVEVGENPIHFEAGHDAAEDHAEVEGQARLEAGEDGDDNEEEGGDGEGHAAGDIGEEEEVTADGDGEAGLDGEVVTVAGGGGRGGRGFEALGEIFLEMHGAGGGGKTDAQGAEGLPDVAKGGADAHEADQFAGGGVAVAGEFVIGEEGGVGGGEIGGRRES